MSSQQGVDDANPGEIELTPEHGETGQTDVRESKRHAASLGRESKSIKRRSFKEKVAGLFRKSNAVALGLPHLLSLPLC